MNREVWNYLTAGALALAMALPAHAANKKTPATSAPIKRVAPAKPVRAAAAVTKAVRGFHAPDAYFVLQKEVAEALLARDLEKAEEACRAQILIRPDRPLPYYNLATVHALRGHLDLAVESMNRAQDKGLGLPDLLLADPDLARLRSHELWPKLVERARSIQDAQVAQNATPPAAVTLQGGNVPSSSALAARSATP